MRHSFYKVVLVYVFTLAVANTAQAWSSTSSQTLAEIKRLEMAIIGFNHEHGRYPDANTLYHDIVEAELWDPENPVIGFVDSWGHKLVYRNPGRYGAFDLYSVGADEIDNEGAEDDISNWSGVNEGYYWKRFWPLGRLIVVGGITISLVLLILGRGAPRYIVLPSSGIALCVATALGSILLRHPMRTPLWNNLLDASVFISVLSGVALIIVLRRAILRIN